MVIDFKSIKNPYLLAYIKAFNIADGSTIRTIDYMFWIDEKHDQYRNKKGLPSHIDLNEKQISDFCSFIGL